MFHRSTVATCSLAHHIKNSVRNLQTTTTRLTHLLLLLAVLLSSLLGSAAPAAAGRTPAAVDLETLAWSEARGQPAPATNPARTSLTQPPFESPALVAAPLPTEVLTPTQPAPGGIEPPLETLVPRQPLVITPITTTHLVTETGRAAPAGLVITQQGGVASSPTGRIQVTIPAQALSEEIELLIHEKISADFQQPAPSGRPFEILAHGRQSHSEVNHFAEPITIAVHYQEADLWGDEHSLVLVYYDQVAQEWLALPSQVDAEANILSGTSDHLTAFDLDIITWQTNRPPTLDSFQVSGFSGASSYQSTFWVPPGPGGLQPSLAVSYNSQIADATGWRSQASWLGLGWALNNSYIQRNMAGSDYDLSDDVFQLVIAGVAYALLPVADGNAPAEVQAFHTDHESFLRIWAYKPGAESDTITSWLIWGADGTRYYFGEQAGHRAQYPYFEKVSGNCSFEGIQTWYWGLSRQVSVHNQALSYDYQVETATKYFCDNAYHSFQHAIYPATITYPNNRYQVSFVLEPRLDYEGRWLGSSEYVLYDTQRLDKILILQNQDGDGTFETVIRRYEFTFAGDGASSGHVFPGRSFADGQAFRSTLLSIQEFADADPGSDSLPAATFVYDDEMHLTTGQNGYGGEVVFQYDLWHQPWPYSTNPQLSIYDPLSSTYVREVEKCSGSDSTPPDLWLGDAECQAGTKNIILEGHTALKSTWLPLPLNMIQPGGSYYLAVSGRSLTVDPTEPNRVGLQYGPGEDDRILFNLADHITQGDLFEVDTIVTLPANADRVWLYARCKECQIQGFFTARLVTRYRVIQKELYDGIDGLDIPTFRYFYDEPASNDPTHSTAVSDALAADQPDLLLTPQYGTFRGHAVTTEEAPDGRITTTYYHQDDNLAGKAHTTTVTQQSFKDSFDSSSGLVDLSAWNCSAPNNRQKIVYALGDMLLENSSTNSTYHSLIRTQNTLRDQAGTSNTVLLQFQLRNSTGTSIFRLFNNQSGTRLFGLRVESMNNQPVARIEYNKTQNWAPVYSDLGPLQINTWYVLQLTIDDENGFYLRLWQRDNPAMAAQYYQDMDFSGRAWQFRHFASNTTTWLDEYREVRLHEIKTNLYSTLTVAPGQPLDFATIDTPDLPNSPIGYHDLDSIRWTRLDASQWALFDGDADWVGTRREYQYQKAFQNNTQYGNQTHLIESLWNASTCSWEPYRATAQRFYPRVTASAYLVDLPANNNQFVCPNQSCSFATSDIVASQRYLYDGNNNFYTPPSHGIVYAIRTQLNSALQFQDLSFVYDIYGNQVATRAYQDYGSASGLNLVGRPYSEQTTSFDSLYHTYPVIARNALNHTVATQYDERFGLPDTITDANGSVTTVSYDTFGRIERICYPGDDCQTEASMSFAYADTGFPFYTTATQKVSTQETLSVRKLYDGLGQLLQSQILGAQVEDQLKDIVVEYEYDTMGRVVRQSVPYAVTSASVSYQPNGAYFSQTSYDVWGRVISRSGTDNTAQTFQYDDLETTQIDARGNQTFTMVDVWGRRIAVVPPDGPAVQYQYDTLDRLLETTYGIASIEVAYNMAGQRLTTTDSDLGFWQYQYQPNGNLVSQTDAELQTTCYYYDAIGRLLGKLYQDENPTCPSDPGPGKYVINFQYDQGSFGIGQRTGMYDSSGYTLWDYDLRGRLVEETKAIHSVGTFTTSWDYGLANQLESIVYPDGEIVQYSYHAQLALESVTGLDAYVTEMQYDEAGRLTGQSWGDGLMATNLQYNAWNQQGGRLASLVTGSSQSLSYGYDENGNITSIIDTQTSHARNLSYDDLNRITAATVLENGQITHQENYTYDAQGRLATKTGVGAYVYAPNHVHAAQTAGNHSYSYDANGNMVQRTIAGLGVFDLVYNYDNQLMQVSGADQAAYVYDGDGQQVLAMEAAQTSAYVSKYYEISYPTLTDGGLWKFDEGLGSIARDVSPYFRHGTIFNAQRYLGGHSGQALDFNGSNAYIDFSSEPQIVAELTVSA
ncbi:MAG: RHS repeat protein, partial [Anaerolineales bacterium]|nr:RHS repeat protein [Anaerolineales bacterium]